jgi:hypothetical protein
MHLEPRPSHTIRLSRLRECFDDPPTILKHDLTHIRVAEIDEPSHRVRLSYFRCDRTGVARSHLLPVDPAERVHFPSRTDVFRTSFSSPARAFQTQATAAHAPPSPLSHLITLVL